MRGKGDTHHTHLQRALISHELRNALSGIAGLSQQLSCSGLTAGQLALVRALEQSTRQMRWLVRALGQGGESALFPLSPRLASLPGIELMEQLVHGHTVNAREAGMALLLDVRPDVPSGWRSDKRLLRLVLDNLLSNAIKYGRGEIMLEVEAAGDGLIIRVRNGGLGLDADAQSRMFEPWVRCAEGESETSGAGLGLYLCRCIMSRLTGSISYSAESAGGSCLALNLPSALPNRTRQSVSSPSRLLQSLVCVLSLHGGLRRSLASILARLSVARIVSAPEDIAQLSFADCVIEITDRSPAHTAGMRNRGLWFTASAPGRTKPGEDLSRWLPQPFLESTVGPVLMELVLERRLSRTSATRFSPAKGEMQDSVPKRY